MATYYKPELTFQPGSKTMERGYYTSPNVFSQETTRIFNREWFCAGHSSRIRNPGNFFVLEAFDESILILRDHNDQVRAFYNLCRHRGTQLCEAQEGRFSKSIQCPYHAWTYGLDGKLIGATLMKELEDFNKENYPLVPVEMQLWEGFIFLNLSRQPKPFNDAFAILIDKFRKWNLPRLRPSRRIVYDVKANWKFIFQNYNECGHCPPVHPQLTKISPYDSGENDLIDGPFVGGFMVIDGAQSLTLSGNACAMPVGDLSVEDHSRVYYYSIFPNLLLSLHPDYVMFHTIWPQSVERSVIWCEWLFHPEAFERKDFHPEDGIEFWDLTNRQDWHMCELSQRGVSSRGYQPGPYSPREALSAAFDRYYLNILDS